MRMTTGTVRILIHHDASVGRQSHYLMLFDGTSLSNWL